MSDRIDAARRPASAPLVPGIPGLAWADTRAAAADLAQHGWPVLPGTYQLAEHGAWLGKLDAAGLEPAAALWQLATTTNPDVAMEWWTRRPYSVLLACGAGVNGVEVPGTHRQRALAQLSPTQRGPVALTPLGSWLFFVRSDDEPLRRELAANAHAQLHASGAWLPIPPTARDGLPYRWRVPPSTVGWALPASAEVQRVLVASLSRQADGARPSLA
ncbi:MAG: bifunctional DNA primase/polymerase [Pseudonocardiaceae bacterium]